MTNTQDNTQATPWDVVRHQRRERNLRELASDLADLVESGDLTDMEANEWLSRKADQWA